MKTDWSHLPKDDTLIFFDDHQNFYERLKHANSLGFKKIMTEDNYPYQQGDCYTPKKILANRDYIIDNAGYRVWYDKNDDDLKYFNDNVLVYQEMPPLFKGVTTRWGDAWDDKYEENKDYTWICYIEMN